MTGRPLDKTHSSDTDNPGRQFGAQPAQTSVFAKAAFVRHGKFGGCHPK